MIRKVPVCLGTIFLRREGRGEGIKGLRGCVNSCVKSEHGDGIMNGRMHDAFHRQQQLPIAEVG